MSKCEKLSADGCRIETAECCCQPTYGINCDSLVVELEFCCDPSQHEGGCSWPGCQPKELILKNLDDSSNCIEGWQPLENSVESISVASIEVIETMNLEENTSIEESPEEPTEPVPAEFGEPDVWLGEGCTDVPLCGPCRELATRLESVVDGKPKYTLYCKLMDGVRSCGEECCNYATESCVWVEGAPLTKTCCPKGQTGYWNGNSYECCEEAGIYKTGVNAKGEETYACCSPERGVVSSVLGAPNGEQACCSYYESDEVVEEGTETEGNRQKLETAYWFSMPEMDLAQPECCAGDAYYIDEKHAGCCPEGEKGMIVANNSTMHGCCSEDETLIYASSWSGLQCCSGPYVIWSDTHSTCCDWAEGKYPSQGVHPDCCAADKLNGHLIVDSENKPSGCCQTDNIGTSIGNMGEFQGTFCCDGGTVYYPWLSADIPAEEQTQNCCLGTVECYTEDCFGEGDDYFCMDIGGTACTCIE